MESPNLHFVVSAPRSGSTWLARALNGHPEVLATEHKLFGNFCELWPTNQRCTAPRITVDAFIKAFGVHYFHDQLGLDRKQFESAFQAEFAKFVCKFATDRSNAKLIIDKVTPFEGTTEFVMQQIRTCFPNSKIIHLVRDGRDMVTSATFDWLLKDAAGTDRHKHFVENENVPLPRFFDDDVLRRWAEHWSNVNQHVKSAGPDLEIWYESMISDNASVLKSVFDMLGLSTSDEILDAAVQQSSFASSTGRNPGEAIATAKTRKGVIGDWKNYFTRADGVLFQEIAGRELIEFGYEENGNWTEGLPDKLSLEENESQNV